MCVCVCDFCVLCDGVGVLIVDDDRLISGDDVKFGFQIWKVSNRRKKKIINKFKFISSYSS